METGDIFSRGLWAERAASLGHRLPEERLDGAVVGRLREEGQNVGIACSGGPDSLCLLLLSVFHCPQCRFFVLHYNHARRGEESDADEVWVHRIAKDLGLPFFSEKRSAGGRHSEAALREDRYAFFEKILLQERSSCLLLGHQLDDVCESWVMNCARGAALGALASPPAVQRIGAHWRLRPLIHLERRQIESALRQSGIPWREDSSNRRDLFLRNRLRHRLLPRMEEIFSHRPWRAGWQRVWRQIAEADEALRFYAGNFSELLRSDFPDFSVLRGQPRALWRRVLENWLDRRHLRPRVRPANFEKLLKALTDGEKFSCSLGAQSVLRAAEHRLTLEESFLEKVEEFSFLWSSSQIEVPGGVLKKKRCPREGDKERQAIRGDILCVQTSLPEDQKFLVRNWRDGDAYRPFGLKGTKKLKKMFQERRIPPKKRRQLPVIALPESEKIVWVPLLPPGEDFRVPAGSASALELTFRGI